MPGSIFYLSWLQAKADTKLGNRSFLFASCFKRINTKNSFPPPPHPYPRKILATTHRVPHGTRRLASCWGARWISPRLVSTPDQTFKVPAASASKERPSEIGTSFLSGPPSVPPFLPSSLPCLHLPFPPLSDAEGATQPTIHSQQRKRGREMLSTVTRQAPSLSLQTFQEISEETLLLQAEGFQRSPLALASPDPPPVSGQRGKGRGLAAGRATWTRRGSGEGSTQEDANQEQRAEMLAPSRWAPPAASQVWEISASSEAPEGTSPVAT